MNAITTDGPARSAIAAAVRTKRPAPMMAPMPSATSAPGPRVRLSWPSPVAAPSTSSASMDLVRVNDILWILLEGLGRAPAARAPEQVDRDSGEQDDQTGPARRRLVEQQDEHDGGCRDDVERRHQ